MTRRSVPPDPVWGWMDAALRQACRAVASGEVPVGAVLVADDRIVARAHNRTVTRCDPTAHAEVLALRAGARRLGTHRLAGTTLVSTVEPCPMCMGALLQARVGRLVFGCEDPKAGAAATLYRLGDDARLNHRVEVSGGVRAEECAALLREFFRQRR